jgi:glycosyltransferase involved in cell wall biosynthesis
MVTPRYLPHMGGVERYVQMLSRRLVERQVHVTILTTDPERALKRTERTDGVEIIRVPARPRKRDLYFAPEILQVVRRGFWDVIHVQSYHTLVAPLAMYAAKRAEIPYVLTFHGGGHSSSLRRAIRRPQTALLRPLIATADRLVAIADFEIELYGRIFAVAPDRFVRIPVATDFSRLTKTGTTAVDPALIASVGRLERYKGHHRVVEALPEILVSRSDARLWIAGSGPYERQLRRLAEKLGVGDRVEIRAVPVNEPETMAAELARVAVVLLLSDYETMPLAVLEAVALRRPVIVTRNTGLAELADRGLVRAISNTSGAREVAAAVLEQLHDPFIPKPLDLPSWEDCAARHHELYLAVAAHRSVDDRA